MPSSQGHHVRTRGRRRGRLQELPNMPLDIIFEVFSHMDPMSLLNLTRTTKAFRQLLLNRRTAATFWRNARGNVPSLPECPVYMSEPAFANLCFDSHCHKCLRSNIHNVSWAFRARYCRDCRPHMVVERLEAKDMLSQASVFHKNYDIYDLLISESGYGTGREVTNFHRPDLEALIVQWKDSGPDEQDKIHATQVALNRSMRENAQNCAMWQNLQKNLRSAEIDRLKTERYSEILHRLRETEWGEFIDSFPFIVERRLLAIDGVKRARPLSDRSWINLRERIFDGLERTRSALLPPPSRSTIINRIRLLSDVMHSFRLQVGLCFPGVAEFASMKEVRRLIMAPEGMKLNRGSFQILQESLSDSVQKWVEEKREVLKTVVTEKVQYSGTADIFELGVTLCYRCRQCCTILLYPGVLAHTCYSVNISSGQSGGSNTSVSAGDPLTSALQYARLPSTWTPDSITVEVGALTDVILSRGMDPSTTSIAEMDTLDAISRVRGTLVMTWRAEAFQRINDCDVQVEAA